MMFVYPKDGSTSTNLELNYWTGINYGNCGSRSSLVNATSEKQLLKVNDLTGNDDMYDFCHYDIITDFNREEGDRITVDGHTKEVALIERRDTDGNGKVDLIERYTEVDGSATLARREEDKNGDGEMDIKSIYENGKLVKREISDPSLVPL